jgi:hypothetical protein
MNLFLFDVELVLIEKLEATEARFEPAWIDGSSRDFAF